MAGETIKIETSKFETLMKQFNTNVEDINDSLDNVDKYLGKIDGTNDIWRGEVARDYKESYDECSSDFEDTKTKLNDYCTGLKNTLVNFKAAISKNKRQVEEIEETLYMG